MQVDWERVKAASCDGSIAEFRWSTGGLYYYSAHTQSYLVANFNNSVYLHNNVESLPANQTWGFWF